MRLFGKTQKWLLDLVCFKDEGTDSLTMLENVLSLVLHIFLHLEIISNFDSAKPYGLANQKLCCFQGLQNLGEKNEECSWECLFNKDSECLVT